MKYPDDDGQQAAPQGPAPIIFEGIVRQLCVAATYNRTDIVLAPHVIYTKHDGLFTDAVVLERNGKPPKELKIGTFKLAGLAGISLTTRQFFTSELFDRTSFKYADALMAVEPA